MSSLLNTTWTISSSQNPEQFTTLWATFGANGQGTIMFVSQPKFQNPATWQQGKRFVSFSMQFDAVTDGSSWSLQGAHDEGQGSGTIVIDSTGVKPATYPFKMVKQ